MSENSENVEIPAENSSKGLGNVVKERISL